jgi:hypothetical protein
VMLKKTITHLFIALYLIVSLNAFLFTMTRLTIPGVPWKLTWWSYAMMAPFQGYSAMNEDLRAEGKDSHGNWKVIDLERYSPMILGNQIMHRRLMSSRVSGEPDHKEYRRLAERLQKIEAVRGNIYTDIRLTWQGWPVSPEGWDANRTTDRIVNIVLAETP